ncbi:deoxyribonuclease V [Anaerolineales bacterium]
MKTYPLHPWNLTPSEAIQCQKSLASQIIDDQPIRLNQVKTVAGVDVSVKQNTSQAAVIILSFPDLQVIEVQTAIMPTQYPYIPGLLTFREAPVLLRAFEKVQQEPDVLIFDGMGKIHPRGIGIASHMGLFLDKPTIGCGKTHFVGEYAQPLNERGAFEWIHYKNDIIGAIVRTRVNVKPVYISVGHRTDLATAIELIMATTPKYRLPEPIRQAHNTAGQMDLSE